MDVASFVVPPILIMASLSKKLLPGPTTEPDEPLEEEEQPPLPPHPQRTRARMIIAITVSLRTEFIVIPPILGDGGADTFSFRAVEKLLKTEYKNDI
jgi:hypothetical protein